MTRGLDVVTSGLVTKTSGLSSHRLPELEVAVSEDSLLPEARRFLLNMGEALQAGRIQLRAGETVQCGYWIVKFDAKSPKLLTASEPNAESTGFVHGASLALTYWRDQHSICEEYGAEFAPPLPRAGIACSDGVLEGVLPVGGSRYRYSGKMSGWFLSTHFYDTKDTVTVHHAYHVTAARPELARYLALPPGYRFDHGGPSRVWFDPELAAEEPW